MGQSYWRGALGVGPSVTTAAKPRARWLRGRFVREFVTPSAVILAAAPPPGEQAPRSPWPVATGRKLMETRSKMRMRGFWLATSALILSTAMGCELLSTIDRSKIDETSGTGAVAGSAGTAGTAGTVAGSAGTMGGSAGTTGGSAG